MYISFWTLPLKLKVGRSKPPPDLTAGYNRTGQYAKKWSALVNTNLSGQLKNFKWSF